MTDKEQIIIDGVEVLKEKINMCFILLLNKLETPETIEQTIYEHLDAFVKEWNAQLAHKAQLIDEVEEVIKPYQEQIELDALSLPIAIESILERKEQECEKLKIQLMQKDEVNTFVNTFFNAPLEGWSSDPCGICESKNNYEQLKQEYENLKGEEKYLKQCCQKAGEELAKHSFEYDGKEKNLVVQAMELNEKYEKLSILAQEESARNGWIEYELNDRLKQKTQECESLKKDYAELERECERLKSYGATLLADKNAMEIGRDDYMQRCKRLEQECEELKEKNKVLQKLVSELEYSTQTGIELNDRYCKALEEIEKICLEDVHTFADGTRVRYDSLDKILDIINKAKGRNNE